jgi:hypothetical protein
LLCLYIGANMYLNYINNFRGLAIILIVTVHVLTSQIMAWQTNADMQRVLHIILTLSSGYFVFLAGFLFQHLSIKYNPRKYAITKLNYVILPYIIISIPAIIDDVFIATDGVFNAYPHYQQIILYYATGMHITPFWFMPMIFLFFLAAPLLLWLDKQKYFYWLLPVFLIISVYVTRELQPIHNPFQSFIHFLYIYLFGMFVSHHKAKLIPHLAAYWWLLLLGFGIILMAEIYLRLHGLNGFYADFLRSLKFIVSAMALVGIFYHFDAIIKNSLNFLAEPSFGIYFVHNYYIVVIEIILRKLTYIIPGNLITLSLFIILVMALSYFTLWLMRRIFGQRSRMLVGY